MTRPNITYQQEFLDTFIPDASPLIEKDWLEVQHDSATSKVDPDWDLYYLLEGKGNLYIFTCRVDGKLAGYFTAFVAPNPHSKGSLLVSNDAIFLDKPYRLGHIGIKLIRFSEECLRKDGYESLQITTTELNPIDNLMRRLGYFKVSSSFRKVL